MANITNPTNLQDALKGLSDQERFFTVAELLDYVKDVTGEVKNRGDIKNFIVYAGTVLDADDNAVKSFLLTKAMRNAGDAVTIWDSDIGQLMVEADFQEKLRQAVSVEFNLSKDTDWAAYKKIDKSLVEQMEARKNFLMTGDVKIDGKPVRIDGGSFWDIASANYAAKVDGNLKIIANSVREYAIILTTELPKFVNVNIGKIGGVPLSELVVPGAPLSETVNALLALGQLEARMAGLSVTNTADFAKSSIKGLVDALNSSDSNIRLATLEGFSSMEVDSLKRAQAYYKAGKEGGFASLEMMGIILDVGVSAVLMMNIMKEARLASDAGNDQLAAQIIKEKTIALAGSVAVGAVVGSIAGSVLLGVGALGGPIGIAVAFALTMYVSGKADDISEKYIDKLIRGGVMPPPTVSEDANYYVTTYANGVTIYQAKDKAKVDYDVVFKVPSTDGPTLNIVQQNSITGKVVDSTYASNAPEAALLKRTIREQANGKVTDSRYEFDPADGTVIQSSEIRTVGGEFVQSVRRVTLASGTSVVDARDAAGNWQRETFDEGNFKTREEWRKPDGSEGFTQWTSGSNAFDSFRRDADGTTISLKDDGAGYRREQVQNPHGELIKETWKSTLGSGKTEVDPATGTRTSVEFRPDGTLRGSTVVKLNGDTTIGSYDGAGKPITLITTSTNGQRVEQDFNADGSSLIHIDDSKGNTRDQVVSSANKLVSETWRNQKGESGSTQFNVDGKGTNTGTIQLTTGDRLSFSENGGERKQTLTDGGGVVRQIVTSSERNGTTVVESFQANITTRVTTNKLEGSREEYVKDLLGNWSKKLTVDGKLQSESYLKADGTSGQSQRQLDGTMVGVVIRPDGSYDRTTDNGDASTVTSYDPQGNFIKSERKSQVTGEKLVKIIDPETGTIQIEQQSAYLGLVKTTIDPNNGAIRIEHKKPDTTVTRMIDNQSGERIVTEYGKNGVGIVTNTIIQYNADGSGKVSVTDANGRVTETLYPAGTLGPTARIEAPRDALDKTELPLIYTPMEVKLVDWAPVLVATRENLENLDPVRLEIIERMKRERDQADKTFTDVKSPLILDLDGDGVETFSINDGVHFDHDGNGTHESTGWVGRDDGLLVLDANGDGRIDGGSELFGNNTLLPNGQKAANGFEALRQWDWNGDGEIDDRDFDPELIDKGFDVNNNGWIEEGEYYRPIYERLRVWRDQNSNGVVDAGELSTLKDAGVAWISTQYEDSQKVDPKNNHARQLGQYGTLDGEVRQVHDVWFEVGNSAATPTGESVVNLPESIRALPNIAPVGALRSLHLAMNGDPVLLDLVQQYLAASTSAAKQGLAAKIGLRWTGADTYVPKIESPFYDEQKLLALDIASGRAQYDRNYNDRWNAGPLASPHVEAGFAAFVELIQRGLDSTTNPLNLATAFTVIRRSDGAYGLSWDGYTALKASDPKAALLALLNFTQNGAELYGLVRDAAQLLRADYAFYMSDPALAAYATSMGFGPGASGPMAGLYAGVILATSGNDEIWGTPDKDVMDGLGGNDTYYGPGKGDQVIWGRGSGSDVIVNPMGGRVAIGAGIVPEDVKVERVGTTVTFSLKTGERLEIRGWNEGGIEAVTFANGAVWDLEALRSMTVRGSAEADDLSAWAGTKVLDGGEGQDTLYGGSSGVFKVLRGGEGNDLLQGNTLHDVVIGGRGNDTLIGAVVVGGEGDDVIYGLSDGGTLYYEVGDGLDRLTSPNLTLVLGQGIAREALRFQYDLTRDLLRIRFDGLEGGFDVPQGRAHEIRLSDGSSLSQADLDEIIRDLRVAATDGSDYLDGRNGVNDRLDGGLGDDYLTGGTGDDTLIGGQGNDELFGGEGNDTYLLDDQSGQDVIYDGRYADREPRRADIETIEFAGTRDQLLLSQSGGYPNALVIAKAGTASSIRVDGWFEQERLDTLRIRFADGSVLEGDELIRAAIPAGSLSLHGGSGNDRVVGTSAAERIRGGQGNDTLDGGAGDDVLLGGTGSDVYLFGRGDGRDWISEFASQGIERNVIRFKDGITRDDLVITLGFGTRFEIRIKGTDDVLTVEAEGGALKVLEFADGTVASLWENPNGPLHGDAQFNLTDTPYDDVIIGGPLGNRIVTTGGDNYIQLGGTSSLVYSHVNSHDTIVGGGYNILQVDGGDTVEFSPANSYLLITGAPGTIRLAGGLSFEDLTPAFGNINGSAYPTQQLIYTAPGGQQLVFENVVASVGAEGWQPHFVNSDGSEVDPAEVSAGLPAALTRRVFEAFGTRWADSIVGGDGNDDLNGAAGPDTLRGGAGNDTLNGGGGSDMLIGGDGDDLLSDFNDDNKSPGDNVFEGGAGDDRIRTWHDGNDRFVFNTGFGRDTLELRGAGRKEIVFGEGLTPDNFVVTGDGYDNTMKSLYLTRLGTRDRVQVVGWFGDEIGDTLTVRFADGTVWDRTELLRRFYLLERGGTMPGSLGADVLVGDSTDDTLIGRDGNDTLRGAQGNDQLIGGRGDDELQGGTGDDRMLGGEGSDVYLVAAGQGRDMLVELTGPAQGDNDVLRIVGGVRPEDVLVRWSGQDLLLMLPGQGEVLIVGDGERQFGLERVEFESGVTWTLQDLFDRTSAPSNTVIDGVVVGTSQADVLQGGAGGDRLSGGLGDDTLDGGAGADTLEGGAGDDVYRVDNLGDRIVERFGGGVDTVETRINWTLGEDVENLRLLTGGLTGTGNAQDNRIIGSAGADTLAGGGGRDTLEGGEGDDTYLLTGAVGETVTIVEQGEGVDTAVLSSGFYQLHDGLEVLRLTGTAKDGYGNGADNTLFGNELDNYLDGADGNDVLRGGAGNDYLSGGWGRDTLDGGEGLDQLAGGDDDDLYIIDRADEDLIENTFGGVDTVQSSVSYTLRTYFENLVLTGSALNGTGNAADNLLTGNALNNRLDGLGGADTMAGGVGDDTYVVNHAGDQVVEAAGEGYDAVESSVTHTLSANVEKLTLTGSSGIGGTGNASDNLLVGNGGNNRLDGGAGNDRLDGGAGNDTMIGGAGDDVFVVGSTGDVVTEAANGGIDTVESSITYTLGNDVERLLLTGTAAINGTGNAQANVLTGNSAANTLTGGAGNDTLQGGLGNDSLVGGAGADLYLFNKGDGTDTIQDSDSTSGVLDQLTFGTGITRSGTTFKKVSNNLEITFTGTTTDKVVVKDWYLGAANQVERVVYADGTVMTNAQVNTAAGQPAGSSTAKTAMVRTTADRGLMETFQDRLIAAGSDGAGFDQTVTRQADALIEAMASFSGSSGMATNASLPVYTGEQRDQFAVSAR